MINPERPLLLASSSRYRAELLARLRLPFTTQAADLIETPAPGENAHGLAARLAQAKAEAVAGLHPQRWVLGSDQAAGLDGHVLGKPGTRERAREQLATASGRRVEFHTAIALRTEGGWYRHTDVTTVHFRRLSDTQIERYLDLEPALDCAGSFKCEGYGITLFEAIDTEDPTALIGLPLIALTRLLRQAGYDELP